MQKINTTSLWNELTEARKIFRMYPLIFHVWQHQDTA